MDFFLPSRSNYSMDVMAIYVHNNCHGPIIECLSFNSFISLLCTRRETEMSRHLVLKHFLLFWQQWMKAFGPLKSVGIDFTVLLIVIFSFFFVKTEWVKID